MTDDKPFFMPEDFVWENQAGDAVYIVARASADRANAKVAPLAERIESQQKLIVQSRQEIDATFKANDVLRKDNARLKEENQDLRDGILCYKCFECGSAIHPIAQINYRTEIKRLQALNATYRKALDYASGCLDGTIRDYADLLPKKISEALAAGHKEEK